MEDTIRHTDILGKEYSEQISVKIKLSVPK